MESTNDGLTLWYDTPDAPVEDGVLTVGVRPAHPTNSVSLSWRIDGGFVRSTAASALPAVSGNDQYFRVPLPAAPEGALVEVLPVLTAGGGGCRGRRGSCPGGGIVKRRRNGNGNGNGNDRVPDLPLLTRWNSWGLSPFS